MQELNPALLFRYVSVYWINYSSSEYTATTALTP